MMANMSGLTCRGHAARGLGLGLLQLDGRGCRQEVAVPHTTCCECACAKQRPSKDAVHSSLVLPRSAVSAR